MSSKKILLTSENIHKYYEIESKKDKTMKSDNFMIKMILKNYSFINIPPKQLRLFTNELLLKEGSTNEVFIYSFPPGQPDPNVKGLGKVEDITNEDAYLEKNIF